MKIRLTQEIELDHDQVKNEDRRKRKEEVVFWLSKAKRGYEDPEAVESFRRIAIAAFCKDGKGVSITTTSVEVVDEAIRNQGA